MDSPDIGQKNPVRSVPGRTSASRVKYLKRDIKRKNRRARTVQRRRDESIVFIQTTPKQHLVMAKTTRIAKSQDYRIAAASNACQPTTTLVRW